MLFSLPSPLYKLLRLKYTELCFSCYFVWVWNLVCHTKWRTQIGGVWEEGSEESIHNRKEVVGRWRRLHKELHNLHALPNIIRAIKLRSMRWLWHAAHTVQMINVYKILVAKPERKRPCRRPRRRWEDIWIEPREIGWNGVDWIHLAQDRFQWQAPVNTVGWSYKLGWNGRDM